MKMRELLFALPPYTVSVSDIWIDGTHYEVGDDGETLNEVRETEAQRTGRAELIQMLERSNFVG